MVNTYIIVDIETAGRIPVKHSILSIGACVAFDKSKTFYVELKPINKNYTKEAMSANKLSIKNLRKCGTTARKAMLKFEKWVKQVSGKNKPVFVAWPATFDWLFINYYFHKFLGRNPFESRVLEMKSFFAAKTGLEITEVTRDKLFQMFPPTIKHTHNALDDALGFAEIFEQLFRYKEN
jgi:DNA polymerase III epsilon subunit-like protein